MIQSDSVCLGNRPDIASVTVDVQSTWYNHAYIRFKETNKATGTVDSDFLHIWRGSDMPCWYMEVAGHIAASTLWIARPGELGMQQAQVIGVETRSWDYVNEPEQYILTKDEWKKLKELVAV